MGTTGQSITLANSIIGVGILAMPFCFQQCGVVLATLVLILMGLVSRLCCYFLLKSALLARRRTFEFLAFHVFGPAGKLAVEVGIIGFLMGSCIAYFVVVGDLGPQIIAKMFNINQSDILRTSIMVIVSVVCVLPLGLLRNVDSLSNVSAATICFYLCLVLKVTLEAASQMFSGSGEWPARVALWRPAGLLQCVPIMSMALFCQTQLFEIFESMPTISLEKMTVVSKNAINICTAVYFTLGLFGYIAFNDHEISGNILMSLSPTMASDVIKLGFVMSVAFSFPLIIFPCRASLYSFLYKKVHSAHHDHIINNSIPETSFRCITVAIIGVSLIISLLIPNIELVLGLVGSTIGVLICVVFPAACFVNVTFKDTNERILAKGIVVLGLAIMVLGTFANLEAAESRHGRYDEAKLTRKPIDQIVQEFFQKREREGLSDQDIKPLAKEVKNGAGDEKDSEVQPPNPVPPDPSNEKAPNINPDNGKKISKDQMKVKDKKINDEYDKVSETHPKNLNKHNGLNTSKVGNEIKAEIEKPNEVLKPVPDEKENKPKEDKTDVKKEIIKQQQLIDTIKQHGEEQKELLKEQKELLDEIIKTKNEMEQNKKEVNSNEAKIIAVESIQKIADMAIKSLSGVTDKPKVAQEVPLEKIANKAVQEIAKKAVETIEAIKEIKEAPLDTAPKKENDNFAQSSVANSVQNVQSNQNIDTHVQNKPPSDNVNMQPIIQNALPVANQQVNMQQNIVNLSNNANVQPPSNTNMQPDANIQRQQQSFNNQQQQQANIQPQQQQANIQQQQQQANIQQQQQQANIQQQQQQANIQQQQQNTQHQHQNIQQQHQNSQQKQAANMQQQNSNIQNQQPVNIQYQQNIQQQQSANLQHQAANIQNRQSNDNQQQQELNILPVAGNQKPGQQPPIMQQGNDPQIQLGNVQINANQHQQNIQAPNNNQQSQQNANIQQQQQQNIQQSSNIQKQQQQNANQQVAAQNLQQSVNQQNIKQASDIHQQNANQQLPIVQNLQPANIQLQNKNNDALIRASRDVKNDPPAINDHQNVPTQNEIVQNEKQKPHSHSPDEPQSYKEGEDFESGKRKNIAQNVPVPVAMNSNEKSQVKEPEISAVNGENKNVNVQDTNKIHHSNNVQNNGPEDLDNNVLNNDNVAPIRHKREVVDCTEIDSLKPEDREICKKLVNNPKIIDNTQKIILKSNVDLGNVELPNNIPMHETMIHHVRSLKSMPESRRR